MTPAKVAGLLLAAGSGSRLGRPKALLADQAGVTFMGRALQVLADGGCDPVYAVLGAAADEVRDQVPNGVRVVVADDWREGMGHSLRTGLAAVAEDDSGLEALVVMLVDTPGVTSEVVSRLVSACAAPPGSPRGRPSTPVRSALARSAFGGVPGHPVLIGRDHWKGVAETAHGDSGARDYLAARSVQLVESGDIGTGDDIDTARALAQWRRHRGGIE